MKKTSEKELARVLRRSPKKGTVICGLITICFLLACVFTYLLYFRMHVKETGSRLGEGTGVLVGRALGSIDGITRGQIEGFEAGKAEGLSAKDTTAELAGKIRNVERLEVLVASGTFSDVLEVGKSGTNYAALLSMKYHAVVTVDLGTADIELMDDGLHILLDQPVVDFLPIGEIEKRNEYQKGKYTGSAVDGYDAAVNSMNEIRLKAQEKLQQDETIISSARNSAVTQLTQLVDAVSLTKPTVIVSFR